jgi:hypothetical protein
MSADREVVATTTQLAPAAGSAAITVPTADAPAACANCGATVSGHYCSNCGQRVGHAVHSLWHFLSEVAEDLTHADSRLWRTMTALLFKPGYLTCEFLAGRRATYLPPFRLYLVMSVFFFLILALDTTTNLHPTTLAQLQAEAATEEDRQELKMLSDKGLLLTGDDRKEHGETFCANLRYGGPWKERIRPTLRESCLRLVRDNGHEVRTAFLHNLPRAIFLLLPILALVMKPLYWRPPRYFVEHLLLLLHNHAFAFLALGLFMEADSLLPSVTGVLFFVLALYIPYYYYRGMRRVYGQGVGRTLGKLTVLSLAYGVVATLVLVATAIYSVLVLEPA